MTTRQCHLPQRPPRPGRLPGSNSTITRRGSDRWPSLARGVRPLVVLRLAAFAMPSGPDRAELVGTPVTTELIPRRPVRSQRLVQTSGALLWDSVNLRPIGRVFAGIGGVRSRRFGGDAWRLGHASFGLRPAVYWPAGDLTRIAAAFSGPVPAFGRCSHGNFIVTFGRTPGPDSRRRPGTARRPTAGWLSRSPPSPSFGLRGVCPDLWRRLGSRGQRLGGQRGLRWSWSGSAIVPFGCGNRSRLTMPGSSATCRDCGRLAERLSWF